MVKIRVASMRFSGIVAGNHLNPGGTLVKSNPSSSILQVQQKQGNAHASHPGFDCKKECDKTLTSSKPMSLIATSMHEHGWGQENGHSHEHVVEDDSRGTDTTEELRNGDAESIGGSTQEFRNLNNNRKEVTESMLTCGVDSPKNNVFQWVDKKNSLEICIGSIVSGFTTVRIASMRSSGIVACHHLGPGGTLTKSNPTSSILQDQQKQGNTNALHPGFDCNKEYDQTLTSSKPTSLVGTRISRIRNSRVRRLFSEGTDGIEETRNNIARRKEMDCSMLDDHAVGDLNYVGFEEPGEQLQEHALGIVDKIVSINDIELDAEGNALPGVNRNSPPVLRVSGAQSMATRVNPRSPLAEKGIYDWIDSRENDGGGDFFIRKKDALLAGIETNDPTFKTQHKFSDLEGKGEAMSHQSCKKQRGASHLNVGFTSLGQIKNSNVEDSGTELQKNLFEETAEESNKEFYNHESDADALNRGSQDISDVGVGTHLAAEALEALVIGSPASHHFRDAPQVTSELTEDCKIDSTKNKDQQTCAATKKRNCSSTSPNSRRKQLKSSSKKDFRRNSPVQTRSRGKLKHESFTNGGNSANDNDCFSRKKSKLDMGGQVLASTAIHLKEVDKLSKLESNTHLSNNKGHEKHSHGTVTPVAHWTRQSITREISLTTLASAILSTKRQRPKMGPRHILAPESKISQFEMGRVECGSYPKRRRTCQSMSADSTPGTLDAVKSTKRSTALDRAPSVPVSTDALPKVGDATASLSPSKSSNLHEFVKVDSSKLPVKNAENGCLERPLKERAPYPGSVASPPKDTSAVSLVCTSDGPRRQLGKNGLSRLHIARELAADSGQAVQTPALKDMCQLRDMASVRILARMGGSIASSPSDTTHFIADKFEHTRNMLETVVLGKPVVTHLWLENCAQASCYTDEKKYLLRDSKKEMEIGFDMPVSLAHACQIPLLQPEEAFKFFQRTAGKRVFTTHNVKPDKKVIASLVKAIHGQTIERVGRSSMKDNKIADDLLVISCEEDYSICEPLLERGAEVYSSELILNGIVSQKLEYGRHRLFTDLVKRTRSTIWLRKDRDHQFRPVAKGE
ncbi:hypothetical protein ACLOJK_025412 [Asimina triloba]